MERKILVAPKEFCEEFNWPEGGFRALLFHRETNGLVKAGAVLKVGRKLLIHTGRFLKWVDSVNGVKEGLSHE